MKIINDNLKLVSILLLIVFLFQNCVVYHSKTTTLDEAVQSGERVKIITNDNNIYKFKSIQKKDGQVVGLINKRSSTAKKFSAFQDTIKYKYPFVAVLISENSIKEIYLKNKTLSTILTIVLPITIIGGLYGLAVLAYSNTTLDWSGVGQ